MCFRAVQLSEVSGPESLLAYQTEKSSLDPAPSTHSEIQKRAYRSGDRAASGVSRYVAIFSLSLSVFFFACATTTSLADGTCDGRYRVDRAESVNALRRFLKRKSEMIEEESRWLRLVDADCVLSDAAFLGWYVYAHFSTFFILLLLFTSVLSLKTDD